MSTYRFPLGKHLRSVAWIGLGVAVGMLVFVTWPSAHALPEYATRTGQQCATCHVNPAGGGPRTLRGLLWLAQGRPDQVPPLPGSEEEEGEAELDGATLFEKFECSRCHGPFGEGDIGPALNQAELPATDLIEIIRNGTGIMKGYRPDVMSDEEMDAVIPYVQAIGRGEIEATVILQKRLLPPAQPTCGEDLSALPLRTDCGGN
jgi:mono/diheme cytochrome c family protein